jgi:murein L,D-transpeptidase YafK
MPGVRRENVVAGPSKIHISRAAILLAAGLALAACQSEIPKELTPVPQALQSKMRDLAMNETAPIYVRIFKEESRLEVWKQRRDGKYGLLKSYDICKWSGELGPKVVEGDRQAPEGFYTVTPAQMNPQSSYYLAFNIGYPNTFDKAHGRTGKHLMVHGACSSAGCYSMTDEQVEEIFALARDSFRGGQTAFQVHAFPFRMTPENMARHRDDPNFEFWQNLKRGYDHFEVTQRVPDVEVCDRRYVFDATPDGGATFRATAACPAYTIPNAIETAVVAKQAEDAKAFEVAVARLQNRNSRPTAVASASPSAPANATPISTANSIVPVPTARPGGAAAAERPTLLSRIFGGGRNNAEPEQPAAAAPATQAAAQQPAAPKPPASAPAATPVQLPQARPTVVAATDPKPAQPKPASTAAATPPPPAPQLRPSVEPEPKPEVVAAASAQPSEPAKPAAAQSAASTNFDSRFVVPVPTADSLRPSDGSDAGPTPQAMSGAVPMRATGFGAPDCDPAEGNCKPAAQ